MAKKNKKQTRKVSGVGTMAGTNETTLQVSNASVTSRLSGSDFNPDYSQTIKDLKRIGILAGTFFTILVIIAFFLR